jgi:hypothetical protein
MSQIAKIKTLKNTDGSTVIYPRTVVEAIDGLGDFATKEYVDSKEVIVPQADWAETDKSSTAYILNKPFGSSIEFVEVIDSQITANTENEGFDYYQFENLWDENETVNSVYKLLDTPGKIVRVSINGNEYECKVRIGQYDTGGDAGEMRWIGNRSFFSYRYEDDNTGEPFCLSSFYHPITWLKDLG